MECLSFLIKMLEILEMTSFKDKMISLGRVFKGTSEGYLKNVVNKKI